jgi:hypothetical protein
MTYVCILHSGNTCLDILWNNFAFHCDTDRDTEGLSAAAIAGNSGQGSGLKIQITEPRRVGPEMSG